MKPSKTVGYLLSSVIGPNHPTTCAPDGALLDEASDRRRARLAAITRISGALADVCDGDYLDRLRDDWPA